MALTEFVLGVSSPVVIFVATLLLLPLQPPSPVALSPSSVTPVVVSTRVPRRALLLTLLCLASFTYVLDGLIFAIYATFSKSWYRSHVAIASVLGIISYSGLAVVGAWKDGQGVQVWLRRRLKFAVATSMLIEIAKLAIWIKIMIKLQPPPPTPHPAASLHFHFAVAAFRVLVLLVLLPAFLFPRLVYIPVPIDDDTAPIIRTPSPSSLLLPEFSAAPSTGLSPLSSADQTGYGTFPTGGNGSTSSRGGAPRKLGVGVSQPTTRPHTPPSGIVDDLEKPDVTPEPSWREFFQRILRITPYLWPSKSLSLQLIALICLFLLVLGRVVNAMLPPTLGKLLEVFETRQGNPWIYLSVYLALTFLNSGGSLTSLRTMLWAPIMQYSDREMAQLSFDHILNLSFAWHLRRKTGEVLRTLDRGSAINRAFELLLFSIFPITLDVAIALAVFVVYFDWLLAGVIFLVIVAYVASSVMLTQKRTRVRRRMNEFDLTRTIHTDCLLNYETIKYFSGEARESAKYAAAVREYQTWEYRYLSSINVMSLIQNLIITLGLTVGSLIVARRVVNGESKPSHFIIFIAYTAQLSLPLLQLGTIYRSLNTALVDSEKLLRLLSEPAEADDESSAMELVVTDGEIEFDNVSFSYDGRRQALSSVSFKVPKGSSVALVGESGSGKSTILRLLYRFYDLKEGQGRILVDGKDVRSVTRASLRRAIGAVPQDPVLFNSTLEYNVAYGKFGASTAEVQLAAQAAQIHDRIVSFPDGYNTKVGERGVRLSGGERQRVAIARTLLKDPPILLLDEATSALDTSTEKDIQKALQNLVQGRSSLSIAHRLSTIASADVILVLKDGQIIERGSRKELIAQGGTFASMWADQILASKPPDSTEPDTIPKEAKEVVSGYSVGDGDTSTDLAGGAAGEPEMTTTITDDVPTAAEQQQQVQESEQVSPKAEGTEVGTESGPVAFPTSDDTASQKSPPSTHTPVVTFGSELNTPPRSATPDVEAEGKRKRSTPAQSFQRLARRISLTTRKEGSSGMSIPRIPGFGKKDSSNSSPAETSTTPASDSKKQSPAGSVSGDTGKDRKRTKRKSLSLI